MCEVLSSIPNITHQKNHGEAKLRVTIDTKRYCKNEWQVKTPPQEIQVKEYNLLPFVSTKVKFKVLFKLIANCAGREKIK
jgi:hypothetical protein